MNKSFHGLVVSEHLYTPHTGSNHTVLIYNQNWVRLVNHISLHKEQNDQIQVITTIERFFLKGLGGARMIRLV